MSFHFPPPEYWQLEPAAARELQLQLAERVSKEGAVENVRVVAGADVAVGRVGSTGRAAVVLLSYPDLRLIEIQTAFCEVTFPYIPGLLSFRESPVVLEAFAKLTQMPDLVIIDGQGIAHPRGLGIASHLGILLNIPTIGCAKSRLIGQYSDVGETRGSSSALLDGNEVVGKVVRTKDRVKPVFVSVGSKIDLGSAVGWVLACTKGYRLPEPSRLAHLAAGGHLSL